MIEEVPLATFVEVILPLPLEKLYTYRIPTDLQDQAAPGKRVIVQFGNKKLYSALIIHVTHQPPKGYDAKFVVGILDERPLIHEQVFRFWKWMSNYYMCTLGEVMQAALPAAFKLESETLVSLNEEVDLNSLVLTDKEFLITEALTVSTHLTIAEISKITEVKNVFNLLKGLYLKGVITYIENIKDKYKPRTITCVDFSENYKEEHALEQLFIELEKTPKQLDVALALIQLHYTHAHVSKKQLLQFGNISESSIKTLVKRGILNEYVILADLLQYAVSETEVFDLNEEQLSAFNQIKDLFIKKDVVLLHGITSSGKTHVYVKLIEEQLMEGKQVLFLLPEIALTSQLIQRIKKYIGNRAVAYHSKLNQNDRVSVWQKISGGEPLVIIGARSAVFLPFTRLGLVVVDEEHETSYKQHDPAPRYHARDASVFLAYQHGSKTLLGSATPSFESYYLAKHDKYGLVTMLKRFGEINPPEISMADISEDTRTKSMVGYFTQALHTEMKKVLSENKQIILFQNRRGYAPVLECEVCHWIPKCVNCDINLTYHKYNDSLKCHYCGFTNKMPQTCQACGSSKITLKGFGTEKIEDELSVHFPEARVLRMDWDSTRNKNGHHQIIQAFEQREADILVGTQMLSKGLDFGAVKLVGVVNADQLLFFPDFRAHERAYQLLTQVGGRAGRKHEQGKVIIQSTMPNHHVMKEVQQQQYERLFANELDERKKYNYPPFFRLIKITLKHKEFLTCSDAASRLKEYLHQSFGAMVLGPESPYTGRLRNLYLKDILVKIDRNSPYLAHSKTVINQLIKNILNEKTFRSVYIQIDVDPI